MKVDTKKELIQRLEVATSPIFDWLIQQESEKFNAHLVPDKWTTAQHIDHLIKSMQPINKALNLPKLALQTMFGKCKRTEMDYDTIFQKYKEQLAAGGKAPKTFIPSTAPFNKEKSTKKLATVMQDLIKNVGKWEETKLSIYQLPHPLLGKLSIREMLLFTAIHNQHHYLALKEYY